MSILHITPPKVIRLTQGMVAIVDNEDFELLNKFKWYATKGWSTFYATRDIWTGGKKISTPMHRVILGLQKGDGKAVDHRNRNGLDNRRENLRIASQAINAYNSKLQRNNTSGYRGVVWLKHNKRWMARIKILGRWKALGCYATAIEAAIAFDMAVLQYRDDGATLNFPRGNL